MNTTTFESIVHSINSLDLNAPATAPADPAAHSDRLLAVYRAVRPLLLALTMVSLVPPQFRAALTLFLNTFDGFANSVSASGDFKAGKDLEL